MYRSQSANPVEDGSHWVGQIPRDTHHASENVKDSKWRLEWECACKKQHLASETVQRTSCSETCLKQMRSLEQMRCVEHQRDNRLA